MSFVSFLPYNAGYKNVSLVIRTPKIQKHTPSNPMLFNNTFPVLIFHPRPPWSVVLVAGTAAEGDVAPDVVAVDVHRMHSPCSQVGNILVAGGSIGVVVLPDVEEVVVLASFPLIHR